jgi:general stress protein 26
MKRYLCRVVISMLSLVLIYSSATLAQNEMFQQREIPRDSILKVARIIIDSAKCRVLITVDEQGIPHARAMVPFPIEDDFKILLGTSTISRKVKQIKNNPNVVVYYFDSATRSYVTINGTANLLNEPDMKAKYWLSGWKQFYPDRDKDYILIEVTPNKLEVCSFKYKFFWNAEGVPYSIEFIDTESK